MYADAEHSFHGNGQNWIFIWTNEIYLFIDSHD